MDFHPLDVFKAGLLLADARGTPSTRLCEAAPGDVAASVALKKLLNLSV
jgi:hypothetical protein